MLSRNLGGVNNPPSHSNSTVEGLAQSALNNMGPLLHKEASRNWSISSRLSSGSAAAETAKRQPIKKPDKPQYVCTQQQVQHVK